MHTVRFRFLVLDGNSKFRTGEPYDMGRAFLPASLKPKPVHVHTEISSLPGCAATSTSLSSMSSRVTLISMMAEEKNLYFTSCNTSRISSFDEVLHDVSSIQNKPQYGLEVNFKPVSWVLLAKYNHHVQNINQPRPQGLGKREDPGDEVEYSLQDYCLLSVTIDCYRFLLIGNNRWIIFSVTSFFIDFRYQSISTGGLIRFISMISIYFRYRFLSINYVW